LRLEQAGGRAPRLGLGGPALRLEQAGGRAPRLGQTWEVVAWQIAYLGSYHLGKYPWEVAHWEQAFEKVPNICEADMKLMVT